MAFIFPGDLQVGGNLNLDTGSQIILPSGSNIVLEEGSGIEGSGELDGTFSGSFTGSLLGTASFALNAFDGVSASHALRADTADQVSFDVITGLPGDLISSSTQISDYGFISSSEPFDASDILDFTQSADGRLDSIEAKTGSFLTSSVPFDPSDINTRIGNLEAETGSYLTGSGNTIDTASHALIANTASHALNAFNGVSASHAVRADRADTVSFDVITGLPDDLISSSVQIEDLGFITSSTSGGLDFSDISNVPAFVSQSNTSGSSDPVMHPANDSTVVAIGNGGVFKSEIANDPDGVSYASVAIGYRAAGGLSSGVIGANNVVIGSEAAWNDGNEMDSCTNHSVAIGNQTMYNGSGLENVAIGGHVLRSGSGNHNVGIGVWALDEDGLSGSNNVVVGAYAGGRLDRESSNNVFIGTQAGDNIQSGSGNVIIGYDAGPSSLGDEGNKLYIHNANGTPLIYGDFETDEVTINGSIKATGTTLVSASAQITALGFISSSDSNNPDMVNSASHAEFADEAATVHFDNRDDDNFTFTVPLLDSYNSVTGRSGSLLIAGATGGQGLIEFNPSQSILYLGRTSRDGILKVDRVDIGGANIIIGGTGGGKNISMLQGGIAFSSISSPPAAAANNGLLLRSGSFLYFATGSQYQAVVTDSSQIDISQTTGSIPGNRVIGDIAASSVEYGNVLNKPTLISGSTQITALGFISESAGMDEGTISSSAQVVAALPAGTVSGSAQVDLSQATGTAAQATTASYVFYDGVDTAGANWVSSSTQISNLGFMSNSDSGTVSGSAQITAFGFISESFSTAGTSIVSGSTQITALGFISESFTTAGTGIHSGSAQITAALLNQNLNLGTGTLTANELITNIVSSSVQLTTGSNIFGDELTDNHDFTGSVRITGSIDVEGVTFITSSAQITAFGFVSQSAGMVQSASHAAFAESADSSSHAEFAETASHATFAEDATSASFASNASTADRADNADSADSVTFANVSNKPTLVSGSAQIAIGTTTGNLSTTRLTGTISADNVDTATDNTNSYRRLLFVDGVGNDKLVYNTSSLTYNPSLDILRVGDIEGTVTTASYVDYSNVENKPTLVSGSAQITLTDTVGNISGSRVIGDIAASSVDYANVNNKPTLFSSSAQVDLASATGTAAVATRATRVDTVTSNYNQEQEVVFTDGSGNSKQAKIDSSFTYNSSTNVLTVPNVTGTASRATSASYADMAGAVDFNYVENLPDNLVSSSAQIDEFTNGLTVRGGNLKLAGAISLELSASSGQSHIRYRDSAGGNKTFISADHDNDFIKFSNRASNGYFSFFANNATNGASGEQKVAEYRHDKAQFFQPITGSSITASIDASNVDGTVANATSASIATTSSYVDMDDIDFGALTHYDDDTAAAAGGVPVGKLYRNGNFIQVRLS